MNVRASQENRYAHLCTYPPPAPCPPPSRWPAHCRRRRRPSRAYTDAYTTCIHTPSAHTHTEAASIHRASNMEHRQSYVIIPILVPYRPAYNIQHTAYTTYYYTSIRIVRMRARVRASERASERNRDNIRACVCVTFPSRHTAHTKTGCVLSQACTTHAHACNAPCAIHRLCVRVRVMLLPFAAASVAETEPIRACCCSIGWRGG